MMATSEQFRSLEIPVVTRTNRKEPIGTGSYANVYEVMVHETVCAAKEMHPVLMSETKKRAFFDECVRCSRILHPNVVQFLGIHYPSPGAQVPWLVMEMMHTSLTGLIQQYEKEDFPFNFKLSILMDTCRGIQFLHSQNLIHRDLSSNNILLTKHYVAKVSDLGVAKVTSTGLDRHTQAPGTVVFMPPEALSVNPVYGPSIDVFSVGCVCVHLVSLQWPIPSDRVTTNNVVLSEVQRREKYFANLVKLPTLEHLVKLCLQNEPEKRPVIGKVITMLKNIKYDNSPHETDSIIELFKCAVKLNSVEQIILQKDKSLLSKDNLLITKDQQLNQKNQQIRQKEEELVQKDLELFQRDQWISQKDQQLSQKDQQLSEKDQQLSQKNKQLSEKDQQLSQKDQQLSQKDQQLSQKDQQLSEKNQQLSQKVSCAAFSTLSYARTIVLWSI